MKILEALRRGQSEMTDLLPRVLEQEPAAGQMARPAGDEAAAVRMVLGEPVSGPPEASVSGPLAGAIAPVIRHLPIRLSANTPLLPFDNTNFSVAEQYRIIRTRLIQQPVQRQMTLISSAGPGEGKSVTAVNIAGALSLKGESCVVLIDADFRRPTIHTQLGLPLSPGLADVLGGAVSLDEALIRTRQFPNLYVIPAGTRSEKPSELLDSQAWRATCQELRKRFPHQIIDSPPVASVADYDLLLAASDGVVLVLRPDHTRRATWLKALELTPKEKLIGVIINCEPKWFLSRTEQYGGYYSQRDGDKP